MRLQDWVNKLSLLLDKAAAASGSGDADEMASVQDALQDFIDESPSDADDLDQKARRTIIALHVSNLRQRTEELQSIAEEFRRLKKLADALTDESKPAPKGK